MTNEWIITTLLYVKAQVDRLVGPYQRLFLAKNQTGGWKEQTVGGNVLNDFVDGRATTDSGAALIDDPDAFLVLEEFDPTDNRMRYVKVGGIKDGTFLVTLASDGGGDGGSTAGTAPTWTYTIKDYETSTTLKKADGTTDATGYSPLAGTRLGAKATAAVTGTAIRKSNGDLVLVQAHEDYTEGACT